MSFCPDRAKARTPSRVNGLPLAIQDVNTAKAEPQLPEPGSSSLLTLKRLNWMVTSGSCDQALCSERLSPTWKRPALAVTATWRGC
jgi:hypothetical protein